MLNVLINAFGIAGTHMEALSIYDQMKESVSRLLLRYIYMLGHGNLVTYTVESCIFFVHFILQDIYIYILCGF